MPYEIPFTDSTNKGVIVVQDREINDTATSIGFVGKQATGYGQVVAENFLHMLENFASISPPANPVEGQTWYDTTVGVDQLKVYDGTNWVAAGGIRKGTAEPGASTEGELWVDTANQQLYLSNGATWLLVGPEFSQGLGTGARAEQILGTDDQLYTILKIDINNIPVAIITDTQFTPKSNIRGYGTLKPGINLTTRNISNGILKYNGVAEAADSLRVGNLNISSSNFLRSDIDTTASGIIRVKNNSGVEVGSNTQLTIKAQAEVGVIQSNIRGAGLDLKVKDNEGQLSTVIRAVGSTSAVGINNTNPQESLDIAGNAQVSDNVYILGTEAADSTFDDTLDSGALRVSGGASIAQNLKIGTDLLVKGTTHLGGSITIDPDAATTPSIGTEDTPLDEVHAATFVGFLKGSVEGTITGSASSAAKLTNKTTFKVAGDVSAAEDIVFDGSGELTKTFDLSVSNEFITTKPDITSLITGDEILINRTSGETGLYKITQTNFFKEVPKNPVGMIVPYAGDTPPQGWYICDGTIIKQIDAPVLWSIIRHKFKSETDLEAEGYSSTSYFALPDFRGRFLLGADNMGDVSADRVQNISADTVGSSGGNETKDIKLENLPDHEHDFQSPGGIGHYAMRDDTPAAADDDSANVQTLNISTGNATTSGISTSGGILNGGPTGNGSFRGAENLGAALDIMPPYTTINYIIFADN
jgi:microcystin-dependent protein